MIVKAEVGCAHCAQHCPPRIPHHPDGKIFELTINGNASEYDPLEMVHRYGQYNPRSWQYTGRRIIGVQTRPFKWVAIGDRKTFTDVIDALKPHGTIPEGSWQEVVRNRFEQDQNYCRGIADDSWIDSWKRKYFPAVILPHPHRLSTAVFRDAPRTHSFWAHRYQFSGRWRWLVKVAG